MTLILQAKVLSQVVTAKCSKPRGSADMYAQTYVQQKIGNGKNADLS